MNNRLLHSFSVGTREAILARCTTLDLPIGTTLYRPGEIARHAYFLTSGIASVVVPMPNGEAAEVALIGKEGLSGSMQIIGPAPIPSTCFIQLSAAGLRIARADLAQLFRSNEEIHSRILEFIQYEAFTFSQVAGCNRLHDAQSRLARWLLMAQDRADSPILHFTQEFLAEMLGLQRTTVNAVAGALQSEGLLTHSRGKIVVMDRKGLEAKSCSCFEVTQRLHSCLYEKPWTAIAGSVAPRR